MRYLSLFSGIEAASARSGIAASRACSSTSLSPGSAGTAPLCQSARSRAGSWRQRKRKKGQIMITKDERRAIAERIGAIDWWNVKGSEFSNQVAIDKLRRAMGASEYSDYVDDVRSIAGRVCELCEVDESNAYQHGYDEGFASADDWYADRTEGELSSHGLMRLPVGADGEPIRPGDVVTHPDMGGRREVTSVCLTSEGVSVGCADGFVTLRADLLSHADTPSTLADEMDRWIDAGQSKPLDELRGIARRLRALGGGGDE